VQGVVGKLSPDMLFKYVLSRTGVLDPSVIVGPSIGEDAAVIDIGGGKVLVTHVDPITGAIEFLGWLAVHIASNDVAVRGVKPRWLLSVLYLPENATEELVDRITSQVDRAAKEVGAMVVGGHSEFTPGITRPLISMTAIGITEKDRYVTTGGAKVGDVVVMTKSAGIEGTAILATDFRDVLMELGVPEGVVQRGSEFIREVSVVKEALALADAGLVTSMHDPTEGGLLGGLVEIAYASNTTIYVWEERVLLAEETAVISSVLGLDPLRLISSGTLVATVPKDRVGEALRILHDIGVKASVIGYVGEKAGELVTVYRRSGTVEKVKEVYVRDELVRAWELWGGALKKGGKKG